MTRNAPPPRNIPPGTSTFVQGYPYINTEDPDRLWFKYSVWIVAENRWTGQLHRRDAERVMRDHGSTANSAKHRLTQVRDSIKRAIASNRWYADIEPYPEDDE